ncbi:hypothetical protein G7Y79_00029g063880 [Physcia stellaris]|nr:hypothetical protein G7Y79_00029g063880 [Physcia stellaris]
MLSEIGIDFAAIWSPVLPLQVPPSSVRTAYWKTGWDYLQRRLDSILLSTGLVHVSREDLSPDGSILGDKVTTLPGEPPAIPIYSSYVSIEKHTASSGKIVSSAEVISPQERKTCQSLPNTLRSFLDAHGRVFYIALDHRAGISQFDAQQILEGCILALEEQSIDAVLWITGTLPRNTFWDAYDRLVDNRDPHWKFNPEGSEAAILAHSAVRLFFSMCDESSLVHAACHGVPVLALDRDHEHNARYIERLGIALVISPERLNAQLIRDCLREISLDMYGSFHMRLAYVQRMVTGNGERTQAVATEIDAVIGARKTENGSKVDVMPSFSSEKLTVLSDKRTLTTTNPPEVSVTTKLN